MPGRVDVPKQASRLFPRRSAGNPIRISTYLTYEPQAHLNGPPRGSIERARATVTVSFPFLAVSRHHD